MGTVINEPENILADVLCIEGTDNSLGCGDYIAVEDGGVVKEAVGATGEVAATTITWDVLGIAPEINRAPAGSR